VSQIEVSVVTEATEEVVAAFSRLIPQLSTTASPPDRELIAQIISAPSNTVLVARDRSNGARIVGTLTLVMFRIPTALRAWIEDVVVDSSVRGRGVGEALTGKPTGTFSAEAARSLGGEGGVARQIALAQQQVEQARQQNAIAKDILAALGGAGALQ